MPPAKMYFLLGYVSAAGWDPFDAGWVTVLQIGWSRPDKHRYAVVTTEVIADIWLLLDLFSPLKKVDGVAVPTQWDGGAEEIWDFERAGRYTSVEAAIAAGVMRSVHDA